MAALGALALCACDGYADLPLQEREEASLTVEASDLHAGASGRVQVVAELPAGLVGPLVVVGPPAASGGAAHVDGFAIGPCAPAGASADGRLRLCVAVTVAAGPPPLAAPVLGLVIEARGSARRFNASTTLELP